MTRAPVTSTGADAPVPRAALDACIDLAAIAHNVGVIGAASGTAVMAVVKADGYGHGAVQVARAALRAGATHVGVATVDEAMELRRAGIAAPLVAWLHTPSTDFAPAVANDVELAVSTLGQLDAVIAAARATGTTAAVTLKIDTGLNRNGVGPADWAMVRDGAAKAVVDGTITLRAAMCHLAHGEHPENPVNDQQAARLDDCVQELTDLGTPPERVHIANSAAALTRPDLGRDLVRAGIAMYGLSPLPSTDAVPAPRADDGLVPAMTLTAELSAVKRVAAGDGVSYGHTWIAPHDTTLGLVPAGYADGVPRLLSNRVRMTHAGRSVPGVGRICMDQMLIDLGPGSDAAAGDRITLFGTGSDGGPTVTEWADAIGTIDYEIVSGIRGRAVRRWVGE